MNRLILGVTALGVTALGVTGVVWYVKRRPVLLPGYVVAPNCGGVTVTDETQALAFAESQGTKAPTFTKTASAEWVASASASLNVPLICEATKAEDGALGFAYRLLRAYVRGALTKGKIDEPSALIVVEDLRKLMLDNGVPPGILPEGVPGVPKPSPKPGPQFPGPKQIEKPLTPAQREAEACSWAVANKPNAYEGLSKADFPDVPMASWLARVAYRRAYPTWPLEPVQSVQVDALSRIVVCVAEALDPPVPVPTETPTPGRHYRTRSPDKDLFVLAAQAYKTVIGTPENTAAARAINNHPYNKRFWSVHPAELALFPPDGRRIELFSSFGTPLLQAKDPVTGARGKGNYWPIIFIPELA